MTCCIYSGKQGHNGEERGEVQESQDSTVTLCSEPSPFVLCLHHTLRSNRALIMQHRFLLDILTPHGCPYWKGIRKQKEKSKLKKLTIRRMKEMKEEKREQINC